MLTWLKRLITAVIVVGLLASNILTLSSSAFSAMLSGAIAGVTGISLRNAQSLDKQRASVKRMRFRFIKMASRSALGNSVNWIPILGASVAIGLTIWELNDLCESMKDLDEMGFDDEPVTLEMCQAPDAP
jgi:hypothetical protein